MSDNSSRLAKGELTLTKTGERIELKTIADVRYAKYRLLRLQLDYPERFSKQEGDSV